MALTQQNISSPICKILKTRDFTLIYMDLEITQWYEKVKRLITPISSSLVQKIRLQCLFQLLSRAARRAARLKKIESKKCAYEVCPNK